MTAKDVERLFHTYFPEQQSKIVDNDFYLIVRDKTSPSSEYPHFIVCNGASNCDKAYQSIVESGFYQEHVMKVFLDKVRNQ
jgi:hypothetical protein